MQIAAIRANDYAALESRRDPMPALVAPSGRQARTQTAERLAALLAAGVARAPVLERNPMLVSLFGHEGATFDSAGIADAVARWLGGDRAMPMSTSCARPETRTLTTLLRDAWRAYPELRPILVEGSPDAPRARTMHGLGPARRTHHFVLLRMGGRLYVIDGARGLVFDSLRSYLGAVMLSGPEGGWGARMTWFRTLDDAGEAGSVRGFEAVN